MSTEKARTVKCGKHGRKVWQNDVCCVGCDRTYQTDDPNTPHFIPNVCACGRVLSSFDGSRLRFERANVAIVCHDCFVREHNAS